MAVPHRTRTIRDIAHLYLSSRLNRSQSSPLNVFLIGEDRACFSGFHAANVATAFSLNPARVRVFELSGLLPNASFYFCHPAARYLQTERSSPRAFFPALSSISITFDSIRLMSDPPDAAGLRVNVVHLPPLSEEAEFKSSAAVLRERGHGEWWGLYLTRRESSSLGSLLRDRLGVSATFALSLGNVREWGVSRDANLGHLKDWTAAIADRVPVVLRNPHAPLAREYRSICEAMLGRISALKRRGAIEPAVRI